MVSHEAVMLLAGPDSDGSTDCAACKTGGEAKRLRCRRTVALSVVCVGIAGLIGTALATAPSKSAGAARVRGSEGVAQKYDAQSFDDAIGKKTGSSSSGAWGRALPQEALSDEVKFRLDSFINASKASDGLPNGADCGRKCTVMRSDLDPEFSCSQGTENCKDTRCCARAGMQCYAKNSSHAQCKASCSGLPELTDEDGGPWSCEALGRRAAGSVVPCAAPGEDCRSSGCCASAGTRCYEKNASFAGCKAECDPGEPDQSDGEGIPFWSCKPLGEMTPGAASWVNDTCSKSYEDCSKSRCCAEVGMKCFAVNDWYAKCSPSCDTKGSCKELSEKTPELHSNLERMRLQPATGTVAKWVEGCSGEAEDCSHSKCCKQPGFACYQRSENQSKCMEECTVETDPEGNNKSCIKLGPRSYGMARRGWPSLYCWAMVLASTTEASLVREQAKASVGVFACDGHAVVSDGPAHVDGTVMLTVPAMPVGVSSDGTAANTNQFIEAWKAVVRRGDFEYHDWTIKVDPDTVLLPQRIRDHLRPLTLTGNDQDMQYVANCNAYPNTPGFPMMFGSLETFSRKALREFRREGEARCVDQLPWQDWGEDVFMVSCMHVLGVSRTDDFSIIGDDRCTGNGHVGAHCSSSALASFHPFKDIYSWMECFRAATAGVSPEVDPAPLARLKKRLRK